jgi:predicted nucleic acid-binding protein
MTGLDTTALVELADRQHPSHTAAIRLAQQELASVNSLLITPQVIAEFLHVITDARRFTNPLTMTQALDWIDDFLRQPGVQLLMPTQQTVTQATGWLRQFNLGRKRILDCYLAATFHTAGCERIITSNPDDFRTFQVFEILVP